MDSNKIQTIQKIKNELKERSHERLLRIADALRSGVSMEEIAHLTAIDPWFISQIESLIATESEIKNTKIQNLHKDILLAWKQQGFSDMRIAELMKIKEEEIRKFRHSLNIRPVYKRIDSCAAEFPARTAYFYSTYETICESLVTENKKLMVLGSGPNRIGQGIEFDYCCVHALQAIQAAGFETIMVNCNPETVSTDYDMSDRLYFEPIMLENVLEIIALEKPQAVLVQYGGQTPLKLVKALTDAGVTILGTQADAIDASEDREKFSQIIDALNLKQPEHGMAKNYDQAKALADKLKYPVVVRPSYVLGGQAMRIVENDNELEEYINLALEAFNDSPVLIDKYLENAVEVDVDAVCDGVDVFVGGILQHIEPAGIHSGDSTCVFPPYSLTLEMQNRLQEQVASLARKLQVIGPLNVQFAIKNNDIYVIEVNPRVSRTMPFVSKATGLPIVKIGVACMLNQSLEQQGLKNILAFHPPYVSIKRSVFPFEKFPGCKTALGPEMKSTGEVMGIAPNFETALLKSKKAANEKVTLDETELFVSKIQNLHLKVKQEKKPNMNEKLTQEINQKTNEAII